MKWVERLHYGLQKLREQNEDSCWNLILIGRNRYVNRDTPMTSSRKWERNFLIACGTSRLFIIWVLRDFDVSMWYTQWHFTIGYRLIMRQIFSRIDIGLIFGMTPWCGLWRRWNAALDCDYVPPMSCLSADFIIASYEIHLAQIQSF